jgi:PAS domain S-box-containing protein
MTDQTKPGGRPDFQGRYRELAQALPLFVSICSAQGEPQYFSASWRLYGGAELASDPAGGIVALVEPTDRERIIDSWRRGVSSGMPFELECRLRTAAEGYRTHLARITPLIDARDRIEKWVCSCIDITARIATESRLREEARISQTLNRIGTALAAERRIENIVQIMTDEATRLADAEYGAFFRNARDDKEESYVLCALSGLSRESFTGFPMPRKTDLFEATFAGRNVIRLDDVRSSPRYGRNALYRGLPNGHVPVASYLAVPVSLRTGEVVGGLFFGHSAPGMFTERHERLVLGVAAQAAIAIDNARLYERVAETAERLSLAVSAATLGDWSWSAASDTVTLSSQAAELLGLGEQTAVSWKDMHAHVQQEFRSGVDAALARALDSRERYHLEYRVMLSDGLERWVVERGLAHYGGDGRPTGVFGVIFDASERKRLETELRRRAEELAEVDRRKDEFLAILAHELRNPLAPIQNALQIMSLGAGDENKAQRARKVMERQIQQMVRLIDDLMDVSRINRNRLQLDRKEVTLTSIIRSAVESCQPLMDAKQHNFEVELPPMPLAVNADAARLAQAFANLLNNAAKYTEPGGLIRLRAEAGAGQIVVSIKDTGIGISADMLGRVFDMFTQADTSLERRHGGLGIGLTLSRQLIEMHGGTIGVCSDGPGHGSEFTVRLPRLAHPRLAAEASAPSQAKSFARRRVLVAEDNSDSADTLADLLRTLGADVEIARDGRSAVELAEQLHPDVVFMDIGMPELNGYDAARRIRQSDWGANTLLVALTGWGQEQDRERAREAGFDHHLIKPAKVADLRRMLS